MAGVAFAENRKAAPAFVCVEAWQFPYPFFRLPGILTQAVGSVTLVHVV